MWDVVADGANAFQYVCSTVEMNHGVLHQYVKPSLFVVVSLGVWVWDRVKRRQSDMTNASERRAQTTTSVMASQID